MTTTLHSSRQRLAYIAGSTVLGLLFLSVLAINLVPFFDGKNDLMDFGSFYASGMKLNQGENPYDPNSDFIFDIVFPKVGAGGKMMNLNPPISALLFAPLTRFEPHHLMIAWQIVSFLLYVICVWLLRQTYRDQLSTFKVAWAFLLAGFWHTLVLGQIYVVLLLFTVLGWIFLEKRKYVLAGIAIGLLIAMKPNFILWPLFLFVSGYTLASVASIVTALVVSAIPWLFYGTTIYSQWLEASKLQAATLIMPGNNSILGLVTRFGSIPLGLICSVLIVLALLVFSRMRLSPTLDRAVYVSSLGVVASLLASPIAWTGYTILLVPIFFALKKWNVPVLIAAVILAIPFQLVLVFFQNSFTNFVIFGWLYGWGILALLGGVVMNTMRISSIQTS